MDAPDSLSFDAKTSSADEGVVLVAFSGELDLFSAPRMRAALDEACASAEAVCVDLTDVPFMDTTSLSALLAARRVVRDRHGRFGLVGASGLVARIIDQAGLDGLLPVFETRADAIDTLSRAQ